MDENDEKNHTGLECLSRRALTLPHTGWEHEKRSQSVHSAAAAGIIRQHIPPQTCWGPHGWGPLLRPCIQPGTNFHACTPNLVCKLIVNFLRASKIESIDICRRFLHQLEFQCAHHTFLVYIFCFSAFCTGTNLDSTGRTISVVGYSSSSISRARAQWHDVASCTSRARTDNFSLVAHTYSLILNYL